MLVLSLKIHDAICTLLTVTRSLYLFCHRFSSQACDALCSIKSCCSCFVLFMLWSYSFVLVSLLSPPIPYYWFVSIMCAPVLCLITMLIYTLISVPLSFCEVLPPAHTHYRGLFSFPVCCVIILIMDYLFLTPALNHNGEPR